MDSYQLIPLSVTSNALYFLGLFGPWDITAQRGSDVSFWTEVIEKWPFVACAGVQIKMYHPT
jgi:hypothetical protein